MEGEPRIVFLMEKVQEIRKIYMDLKSEVALIDRRRKRAKRKERESKLSEHYRLFVDVEIEEKLELLRIKNIYEI